MGLNVSAAMLAFISQGLAYLMEQYERFKATQAGRDLPEWDEISTKNAITQGKIDAEKDRLGIG